MPELVLALASYTTSRDTTAGWGSALSHWIMKCRRLVRDYERLTRVAETLLRRWQ